MKHFRLLHRGIVITLLVALIGTVSSPFAQGQETDIRKWVRFKADDMIGYGLVEGEKVRMIEGTPFGDWEKTDRMFSKEEVKLLAPSEPTKVMAMALNFRSHVGQLEEQRIPEVPQLFYKAPSCVVAPGEEIVIPNGTVNVHYEAEMVIVIGKQAKEVSEEEALDYVLGVTAGNDVSARDWQDQDIQWWRAKGADTFGPCGPMIVSGIDYDDLMLQVRVNGELHHEESTKDMVRGVARIVSFASEYVTLEPGDLIYGGAMGITKQIQAGDVVEIELEEAGVLRNPVVGEKED